MLTSSSVACSLMWRTARCPAQGAGPRACLVVPCVPPGRQGCAIRAPLLPAATHPPPRRLVPTPAHSWSRPRPLLAPHHRPPDCYCVSTDTALRGWEQALPLSSGCVVLPAPCAHAGVLASAPLRGLWPCLGSRVALPCPALRDRVWAPKSGVSVCSPLPRVCVLVLPSEHFLELAVSLLLSFHLSRPRSHAVVTAERRAVACVHAQPLLPSLPFEGRAGGWTRELLTRAVLSLLQLPPRVPSRDPGVL